MLAVAPIVVLVSVILYSVAIECARSVKGRFTGGGFSGPGYEGKMHENEKLFPYSLARKASYGIHNLFPPNILSIFVIYGISAFTQYQNFLPTPRILRVRVDSSRPGEIMGE